LAGASGGREEEKERVFEVMCFPFLLSFFISIPNYVLVELSYWCKQWANKILCRCNYRKVSLGDWLKNSNYINIGQ
jgi:hypothetical protein